MKYTYSEFQEYFASRRGFKTFASMKSHEQTRAKIMINQVLEEIWYAKQYGFNGDRMQLSFVPALSGTVTGTGGEHAVTLGAAITESYEGIKVRGQYILIDSRLYKIIEFRSTTVVILDAPLKSTVSGAAYKIYFLDYPLPPWVGGIRSIKRNTEDVTFLNEYITELDNTEGDSDFAHLAGVSSEAFYESGTVSVTQNSTTVTHSGTGAVDAHVGKAILIKQSNAYQWFKIVDVTANNEWIIDRPWKAANATTLAFEIEPRGTQLVRFKSFPTDRELVEIKFTTTAPKLVADDDVTLLPTDIPMMAGIEVAATQIEAVGEGNINEILFKDKKFKKSLKALNFRGTPMQNRMYNMQEVVRLRRFPRNTNPWNRGAWWG
jgi:hypothetical protein